MPDDDPYLPVAEELSKLDLFAGVDAGSLLVLAGQTVRRFCRAGELILSPSSGEDDSIYVIGQGSARLFRLSRGGQEITLAFLQPGDIFGLVFREPATRFLSSVQATSAGTVLYSIRRNHFRDFAEAHPLVAVQALALVSRRLAEAYNLIEDLALHGIATRLARLLLRLAADSDDGRVMVTHDELARMVGTSRERVTKSLHDLREHGLISFQPHRRGITVLDRTALEKHSLS